MSVILSRRRFMRSAAFCLTSGALLEACSGNGAGGTVVVPPGPTPGTTPTPVPSPSPTASPSPVPGSVLTVAFAGSSSAEQYLSLYTGPADNSAVTVSSDGQRFVQLSNGAFGKTAGMLIHTETGKSVRFLRGGIGGTTLAQWADEISEHRAAIVRSIRAAGGADVVLLQVGRNDAYNLNVPSIESQSLLLRTLIARLRAEANIPNAMIFIGGSQDMLGGTTEQHRQLGRQRLAEMAMVATEQNVRFGFSTYDLATFDNVHQTEESQKISGTRFAAQVNAWIRSEKQQRGPRISDIKLLSQTQTDIELILDAGDDISPATMIDGFQMIIPGTGNEIPIVFAERMSRNTVRLNHASRDNRQVRIAYALDNDISDTMCLRENSKYKLPAESYLSAII